MYFLVEIQGLQERIRIPLKWIENLKLSKLFNYGVKYHRKTIYKVFICADKSMEPDFQLDIRTELNLQRPACYLAKIIKGFGLYFFLAIFFSLTNPKTNKISFSRWHWKWRECTTIGIGWFRCRFISRPIIERRWRRWHWFCRSANANQTKNKKSNSEWRLKYQMISSYICWCNIFYVFVINKTISFFISMRYFIAKLIIQNPFGYFDHDVFAYWFLFSISLVTLRWMYSPKRIKRRWSFFTRFEKITEK